MRAYEARCDINYVSNATNLLFFISLRSLRVAVMDMLTRTLLAHANERQEELRRAGKQVDKETRLALAGVVKAREGMSLTSEQEVSRWGVAKWQLESNSFQRYLFAFQTIYQRCKEIEIPKGAGWTNIRSTSPYVCMSVKNISQKNGENIVKWTAGRAEGVIDCEATEAAAWLFDYCSNERMRISKERGDPARLVVEANRAPNERTFAMVKKMPFPWKDREFVFKMILKTEADSITIAVESIDLDVDYGAHFKTERVLKRSFYRIANLSSDQSHVRQSKITLYRILYLGSSFASVLNTNIPEQLSSIQVRCSQILILSMFCLRCNTKSF